MDQETAAVLVAALHLFNDQPRFAQRNRRFKIDSYSVASEIERLLDKHRWDRRDPALQPEAR